ncbi:histidine-rich glycoprotein-like [Pomacea canaliculata]|uniref:histidine-rich glycoprotein-like n=1 Tax=Pomacea canaliculata TaxID=400727 RepID=UPI000D734B89|nr:histidine-rich glycoprotein-like [Pomacea canaliculata]
MAKVKLVACLAVLSLLATVILADDSENSVDVDKPSHGPDGHFLKDRLRSHVTTHTGDKRKSGEGHRNGGHGHSNNHNHHKGHGVGKFRVGDGEHKAMEEENHLLSEPAVKHSKPFAHHGHNSKHAGKHHMSRDGFHPKPVDPKFGAFRHRNEHRQVNRRVPDVKVHGHGHSSNFKASHHVGENRHGSANHIRH